MKRDAESRLVEWVENGSERPLVVTGVRGCGKTYMVRSVLNSVSKDHIYLDYDRDGLEHVLRDGINVRSILSRLKDRAERPVVDSIVVIDGIHYSGQIARSFTALVKLAERCRLIVISTIPVPFRNRFEEIRMYPMSFPEFLEAMGSIGLSDDVRKGDFTTSPDTDCLFSEFMAIGGLPAAVSTWLATKDVDEVDRLIRLVMGDILEDATESIGSSVSKELNALLCSIPEQLARPNKKFMFSKVATNARARNVGRPLEVLEGSGAVIRVPLQEGRNDTDSNLSSFKLYYADSGILRVAYGMPVGMATRMGSGNEFVKGMCENTVLTEVFKSGYTDVFAWRSGNKAEAELVVSTEHGEVPIQIDDSDSIYVRSLTEFSRQRDPVAMVHMSHRGPGYTDGVYHIPLYGGCAIPSLLEGVRTT